MGGSASGVNFFCDANISPHLARALDALSANDGRRVRHLREMFAPNTPDVTWIDKLSSEAAWTVITHDRAMARKPVEQEALRRSGLTVFMLSRL
jgi:hypothetical protein